MDCGCGGGTQLLSTPAPAPPGGYIMRYRVRLLDGGYLGGDTGTLFSSTSEALAVAPPGSALEAVLAAA